VATVDPVAVGIPVAAAVVAGVVMANQPTSQPAEFEATLLDISSHNTEMPPQSAATEEDTFMFGEANEETAAAVDESPFSFDDAAAAPSTRHANTVKGQKEAGMKSLFSLFGRKGKETKPVRAKSTSDPDVFLPTTATGPEAVPDASSPELPAAVDDSPFNLEGVSGEDAIASNAAEVTEAEAPTQQLASEDDIASFLNQL
jgi:hypothetical protein